MDSNIVCDKMSTKKKSVNSFKLGVPRTQKDDICKADTWPSEVTVNHCINLQRLWKTAVPTRRRISAARFNKSHQKIKFKVFHANI